MLLYILRNTVLEFMEVFFLIPLDSVDSHSESDLHFHQNSPYSLFGKEKGKNKLSETVLTPNVTNFANCCEHCPLLQAQILENARAFQVKLSPDSTLCVSFKGDSASSHPLKTYLSKWDGSYKDGLYLNFKIPHPFAAEDSVKGEAIRTVNETYALDKLYQKQSPDGYLSPKNHNKGVFFPCSESEAEENIVCDCFKPSAGFGEINKIPVKKPTVCHDIESQLVKDNLDYSSDHLYKTDRLQTSKQNCLHTASGELVISLTLEASDIDPAISLEEDPERRTLAFKFKDSEENQLVTKLYISLAPNSVHEKPKQTTVSTKQRGHSQTLAEDIGHHLAEDIGQHTESSESSHPRTVESSSSIQSDQSLSTLKLWAPDQFFPSFKDTHASQTPTFCARSLSHFKIASAYRSSQVQKGPPKASRPVRSIVFNRNKKARKDQQFRSKWPISNFHWPKTKNKNIHKVVEINDLYHVPLTQAAKCCCSPLLDLTIDLYSVERDSEKLLRVHRKPPKRKGVGKVNPRFSSQCLLNSASGFEIFQYPSPIRRRNNLKMKNILNYCLGWGGKQSMHKNCKEGVFPTPDSSNIKGNDIFTPGKPSDEWSSAAPILSGSRNTSAPLSTPLSHSNERCSPSCLQTGQRSPAPLYLFCKEHKHSSIPCAQTERLMWSPAASYPDGKHSIFHTPSCTNKIQQQKERICNAAVERMDYGSNQVTCGALFPNKISVCSCGNMSQCGIFPKGYTSESVRKKTRANSKWAADMTESNKVNSSVGTYNTMEACCASCHHGFPSFSLHNIGSQEVSKNQLIKVTSFFENGICTNNLKNNVEKKLLKTGDRKNVRFHVGPGTTQEIGPSGTYTASSSNDGVQAPKHFCYSGCPCCQSVITEHFDTSRRVHNCFGSEFKNCLNRESIFLVKCGQETRRHCQCSQEIPIFSIDQTAMCNGRRVAIPEKKESKHIQVCTHSYIG